MQVVVTGNGRSVLVQVLKNSRGDRQGQLATLDEGPLVERHNRVARALLVCTPLSIDAGEVTDKGSVNQRAVLEARAALVEMLYTEPYAPQVLKAKA